MKIKRTHCKAGHEYTLDNTWINEKRGGWRHCKECNRLRTFSWRKIHPEAKRSQRNLVLLKKYDLGNDEYDQMLARQGGVCAISGQTVDLGAHFHVDHDHRTEQVRQLLHPAINQALGLFQDNPEWLRRAADYVEYWRGLHDGRSIGELVSEAPVG
jgi:hypothetical protein